MRTLKLSFLLLFTAAGWLAAQFATDIIPRAGKAIVRPQEIDSVLYNPGIGFMTFQRFNGDTLNAGGGWTEGYPIAYQPFDGDLTNPNHPPTTLAYWRVYWRYVHPAEDVIDWSQFDRALRTAAERGQTLLIRIAPYGEGPDRDVPAWYREKVGKEENLAISKWRTDPENPLYLRYFGGLIRQIGARYDGHPALEAVDVSIVGYWGEGEGSHLLTPATWQALVWCYLDAFKKTPLIFQPLNGDTPDPGVLVRGLPISASWLDGSNNGTGPQMRHLGWRVDCLGDMGFWRKEQGDWCHMQDVYPEDIVRSGMSEVWKKAPVTMEICGTFLSWQNRQKYDEKVVRYIFDQALKWHISSFNAKSSPVPPEWMPLVNDWLRKMGYRFVLRKFTYPELVRPGGQLVFTSWWENKGVAPAYRNWPLAVRLRGKDRSEVLVTDSDIRDWLPGDIVYDDAVYLPIGVTEGEYQLDVAIVEPLSHRAHVKLAIAGRMPDGWYNLGKITVREYLK